MAEYRTELEIKAVRFPERIISGYAAVFGNEDKVGDVIDPSAFNKTLAEKPASAVEVFIGHQRQNLPVGIPQAIRVDQKGLYTETKIVPGPFGDQLLHTAQFLHEHGQKLGLSIGYRLRQGRPEKKAGGGYYQRLLDIDLREYSFASAGTIANPEALTVGVKTIAEVEAEIAAGTTAEDDQKASIGSFAWTRGLVSSAIRAKAGSSYIVEMFPDRVIYRTYSAGMGEDEEQMYSCSYSIAGSTVTLGEPQRVDVQYVPMAASKSEEALGMEWTQEFIDGLPDSSFLYVQPGGLQDDTGRTVPRSNRYFPVRDESGKTNADQIRLALKTIPSAQAKDINRPILAARAQLMLDNELGIKTLPLDAPEWLEGATVALSGVGDRLRSLAETLAEEQAAMRRLGEDTKQGLRIRPELRRQIAEEISALKSIVEGAERVDHGAVERAEVDRRQRELDLISLTI